MPNSIIPAKASLLNTFSNHGNSYSSNVSAIIHYHAKVGLVGFDLASGHTGCSQCLRDFFVRQYISTISDELLDAARIDGAGEFRIYWNVVLPIIAPGMVSLGLIFFMTSWNNFQGPLIYLKSPEKWVMTQAIRSMQGSAGFTAWGKYMAMSVISLIPLLIIFLVFQRRIVEGITAGAIKG